MQELESFALSVGWNVDEKIFWLDGFEGKAKGGYFIRNELFKFFAKLRKSGLEPVGLKVKDNWNLEVIVEEEK